MEKYNVLICDDDKEIVESTSIFLKGEGYNVFKSYNGIEALDIATGNDIHLLILDIMMPDMDGISTLMKLREKNNIPVILVSAKSQDADKILGLTAGADDYITKPFNPSELMARVKSQLRRFMVLGAMDKKPDVIRNGGMELDTKAKTVYVDGEEIKLTKLEYKIVELLMKNIGTVFSNDEIYRLVWNEESFITDNTIAVHIRHIREKIEINPKEPKYLQVVWGVGYKIVANK